MRGPRLVEQIVKNYPGIFALLDGHKSTAQGRVALITVIRQDICFRLRHRQRLARSLECFVVATRSLIQAKTACNAKRDLRIIKTDQCQVKISRDYDGFLCGVKSQVEDQQEESQLGSLEINPKKRINRRNHN